MKPWPRAGGPQIPDGPLRLATVPDDHEALGRERFWDQTEAERSAALPRILELTRSWNTEADVRFASGWLAERYRLDSRKLEAERRHMDRR